MIEWGSVADWVSAGATVAALLAASYAARVAYRQLKVLEEQESDRSAAERIRDASRVAVWVRIGQESGLPELRYINASGMPVYGLTVWVITPEATFEITYVVDGPRAKSKTMIRGTASLQHQIAENGYAPDWTRLLEAGQLVCATAFRDTANQTWFRNFDGYLDDIDDAERTGIRDRVAADAQTRFTPDPGEPSGPDRGP